MLYISSGTQVITTCLKLFVFKYFVYYIGSDNLFSIIRIQSFFGHNFKTISYTIALLICIKFREKELKSQLGAGLVLLN